MPLHRPAFSAEALILPPLSPPKQLTSPPPQLTALRTTPSGVKFIHKDDLRLPNTRTVLLRDLSRESKPSRAAEHTVVLLPKMPVVLYVPHHCCAALSISHLPCFPQSISGLQAQLNEMSQKYKRLDRLIDTMLRQRVAQQDLKTTAQIAKHAAATNPPVDGGSGFMQLQGQAHGRGRGEEKRCRGAASEGRS